MAGSPLMSVVVAGILLAACTPPRAEAQRSIPLPDPSVDGPASLEESLQTRRSVREFTSDDLSLAELGQLAWAAQGVTSGDGLRTAPSAGALYPLEIIVVASRVTNLAPGVYRYLPASHSLELVVEGSASLRDRLARAALGQDWIADAPAIFVVTAIESRTAAKYGSRSRRYVLIEAGCAAENLLLQAVALELGAAVVGAFDDNKTNSLLRLDKEEEALLLIPVGHQR